MLTQKEVNELKSASSTALNSVVNIMKMQIGATCFIGDKDRSAAILEAAKQELKNRMYSK